MKYSNAEEALRIRNVSLSDPCVKPSQKRNPKISQQKVLAINPGWKRELNLPPAAGSRKKGTMRKRDKGGFGFSSPGSICQSRLVRMSRSMQSKWDSTRETSSVAI